MMQLWQRIDQYPLLTDVVVLGIFSVLMIARLMWTHHN
jgi:hypothetical protein